MTETLDVGGASSPEPFRPQCHRKKEHGSIHPLQGPHPDGSSEGLGFRGFLPSSNREGFHRSLFFKLFVDEWKQLLQELVEAEKFFLFMDSCM